MRRVHDGGRDPVGKPVGKRRFGIIWILFMRELDRTMDWGRFKALVFGQIIAQFIILLMGVGIGLMSMYFSFPLIWTCVILIAYSSTSISRDRETGFIELLKASPIREREYVLAKVLFLLFLYLVFSIIYLACLAYLSWVMGYVLFTVGAYLVFGPYLLIFFCLNTLGLLYSSAMRKDAGALVIGLLVTFFTLGSSSFYRTLPEGHFNLVNFNPVAITTWDIMRFMIGSYLETVIWTSWALLFPLVLLFTLASVKGLWKGVKE